VEREAPLHPARVVSILRQCLSSLQEAHALGVLHRDIKPGNIMLYEHVGRTDQVKVLDFGIAKSVLGGSGQTQQDLTRDDVIVGTPRYMSPEQLRGTDLGPPTDLYSLGLVAFELLVGRKAIQASSTLNIISQQLAPESVALPSDHRYPAELRKVVNRMLAKDLAGRYETAEQVIAELDKLQLADFDSIADVDVAEMDDEGAEAPTMVLDGQEVALRDEPQATVETRSPSKPAWLYPVVAIAAVIVVGGVAALFMTANDEDVPKGQPATPVASDRDEQPAAREQNENAVAPAAQDDEQQPAAQQAKAAQQAEQEPAEVAPKPEKQGEARAPKPAATTDGNADAPPEEKPTAPAPKRKMKASPRPVDTTAPKPAPKPVEADKPTEDRAAGSSDSEGSNSTADYPALDNLL
jgi:serine/threonine-protein kinase